MKAKAIQIEKTNVAQGKGSIIMTKAVMVAILSFVLTSAKLFGLISPFSIAFLAALPPQYAITALVGSIIGSFVFPSAIYNTYYIIALCIIFALKLLLYKTLKTRVKPFLLSIVTFVVMAVLSFAYVKMSNSVELDIAIMLIEAMLASTMTYFYSVCANALLKRKSTGVYTYIEISSIIILFIGVLIALCGISILNVNIGVIIGVTAIYLTMSKFGIMGASISSIIVAIGLNLYSIEMLEFSGMLIISSFIAGIFSPLKKLAQMSAFIASSTFCMFLLGAPVLLTYRLIEIFFATAIFIIFPQRLLNLIDSKSTSKLENVGSSLFQTSVSTKLAFAADTVKDLQNDLITVSKRFSELDMHNISSVYDAASGKVCRGCSMQLGCWDKNYNDTIGAFQPINPTLKKNGRIEITQMPTYFQDKCCKLEKLTNGINECYRAYSVKEGSRRHVEESRGLVVEQFNSIADMLLEVSDEFSDINGYDENTSRIIIKAFTKIESEPEQVICSIDKFGRTCVEIYSINPVKTSGRAICEAICTATQRDFDLPSISIIGNKVKIALFEKASHTVDFCAQQSCCNDNSVCGDSYEYFLDSKGYAYCILSDGMGSGKRAAIDSVMTCSILLKLIKAGFGLESAIKLINSSLLVKSSDESLATIDIAKIDLYTGKVEFLKAGAASSYLYLKGECVSVSSSSLPVGIIQGIEFDKKLATVKNNDIIVMVSDGAIQEGEEWITNEIQKCSHLDAREISIKLIYEAKQRQNTENPDDITILVCKISKGI